MPKVTLQFCHTMLKFILIIQYMYTYVNWFSRNVVHTIMNPNKIEKMDMMRMKDIISQLTDVIYLLCDAKDTNITMIMEQFTNLTCEERDSLHITFSHKNK